MENKENLILRFIKNECTDQERKLIIKEAHENPLFKKELIEFKNIYIHENMPSQEASIEELLEIKEYIAKRELEALNIDDDTDTENLIKARNKKSHIILQYSAAAIIIILLALNIHYNFLHKEVENPDNTEVLTATLPIEATNTLYTAKGVKGEVTLPDSTVIILNSDSKITYPAKFTGSTRDIIFSGEGYFNVKKDSLRPMIIHCNKNFKVAVYGTTFNLKTYNNDNKAQTTLISGSIKVIENIAGKEFIRDIAPNQTYTIEQVSKTATIIKNVDTKKVSQWKDGVLSFDSTPLTEAAKILERWHGVKIEIKNTPMAHIPITATFTTESIVQIMDLLRFSTSLNYKIEDNLVTIY